MVATGRDDCVGSGEGDVNGISVGPFEALLLVGTPGPSELLLLGALEGLLLGPEAAGFGRLVRCGIVVDSLDGSDVGRNTNAKEGDGV